MKSYTKVLFAALLAALIMSMAGGVASANRSLSLNNNGTRTFDYSGRYTFAELGGSGGGSTCTILRHIAFHRDVIPKVEGTLIGSAEVRVVECGLSARVLEATNWNIRYIGFTGTLPEIRTIRLRVDPGTRGGFLFEPFFGIGRCLYAEFLKENIAVVTANGEITEIVAEEVASPPTFEELSGISCPELIRRGRLRVLAGSTNIRVRLV